MYINYSSIVSGLWLCVVGLLASAPVLASPDIQQWQTHSGARVFYVYAPELPIVDLQVVFDAGGARDQDKPGLAALTNNLLDKSASGLDANQIAARFEDVGANYGRGAERDMAWVSLRSLTDEKMRVPAFSMLATLLGSPEFTDKDIERERQRMLVGLQAQKQSPKSIASKAFYKALYGDHPYAIPTSGTVEGVKAITRKDLQDFYQRYYVAANATVAVVGALDRKQVEQLVEEVLKGLSVGKPAAALPKVQPLSEPKRIHIPYPSSQTHILIGQSGVYRGDPDCFTLYVGNHALGGGGLVSRLSEEIREKRGLSYSVYSYFSPLRRKGPFIMGMQTRNDQMEEGIQLLNATLQGYVEQGMLATELESSRKNITGGFPLRIDSNKKIIGYLAMIGFYGMPLDYLDKFNERIESVTLENIHETMRRRLQPENMVVVTVGGEE
jgi:zinc protease